jgi:hypothetical protein
MHSFILTVLSLELLLGIVAFVLLVMRVDVIEGGVGDIVL